MKKMKKKKKLSKREKEILLFLYKFRVSEIKTIQTAMRYKNYDNARKLLKRMYDHNYLIRYRLNIYEPYQYALSYKGFLEMGNSSAQTYDFLSQEKYNHLLHSKLVSWIMRDNENLEIKDFISQREKISSLSKLYAGFWAYKSPIFIDNKNDIAYDFMIAKEYNINGIIDKLDYIEENQRPRFFVIFFKYLKKSEMLEIQLNLNAKVSFISFDYLKEDNDFSLQALRAI